MDEELAIIDSRTKTEKVKNFLNNNKKKIIAILVIFFFILISYFGYNEFRDKQKIKISNLYNNVIIDYSIENKEKTADNLIEIIKKKDTTYSPLALYFIIDNNLITEKNEINSLFDILINKTALENEIKNLIIYKKSLFNADISNENELLDIINPLINSNSVWKSHALYLVAEFFYSKNEKQKSKEFYNQILITENANKDIVKEAQKRLNRDLSE